MDRCLIIFNKPAEDALADELDVIEQVKFISGGLQKLGYIVETKGLVGDYKSEISSISNKGYSFVFNLVEAVDSYPEILYFIPALLNLFKIPYTGCPVEAAFSTASKVYAKKIMQLAKIPVADNFKVSEWGNLSKGNEYIVKPIWEDGSVGITEESVFLFDGKKPAIINDKDDNHWFIESYLDGREFNVSVIANGISPLVLPPAEMVFIDYPLELPKIVSYKAKWDESTFQYKNSVRRFNTDCSPLLLAKIEKVALDCWKLFDLHGYARIDMRTDTHGEVYVMEVNANPCISGDSGFVAACRQYVLNDVEIVRRIINDLNNRLLD